MAGSSWQRETTATARRAATAVALAALCLGATACGKKGDPTPPTRVIPNPTKDLSASQRGDQLVLRFSYPATTTAGAKLPGLAAVEVWELTRPLPANSKQYPLVDASEAAAAAKKIATLSGAELESAIEGGQVAVRLPLPPVEPPPAPAATPTPTATAAATPETSPTPEPSATPTPTPTPAPPAQPMAAPAPAAAPAPDGSAAAAATGAPEATAAPEAAATPAGTAALEGTAAAPGATAAPAAAATPGPTPAAAAGATAAATPTPTPAPTPLPGPVPPPQGGVLHGYAIKTVAKEGETSAFSNLAMLLPVAAPQPPTGLELEPRAHGIAVAWKPAGEGEGFAVYRRLAASRAYGEPLATPGSAAHEYLDQTAKYGDRYIYAVTTLASKTPRVESGFGEEREVDYQDRFAPAPPEDLVALPQPGGKVSLVWRASPDTDTVGYLVYRQDPGADFRKLTEAPIAELKFADGGLGTGLLFRYRVTAVDGAGNEGPPTPVVEAKAR